MARTERGASAVEFALVAPVLLALVLGIIEFGNWFNQQITVTSAAREGARAYAIHYSESTFNLSTVVTNAAPGVGGVTATVGGVASGTCPAGSTVTITTTKSFSSLTGAFTFLPSTMTGKAAMRCGG
ncbi:TadE/TadG family type IV pilus assembly protein [Terrabacter sp. RAF57]|uniref:TadE/TadG family type IV pilus assembly protein n=1 Tax=Terrabacter sp. RAF57 TaxID=3233063 RepID=UPI003F9CD1AC